MSESHRHYSHLLWLYPLQESLDRTSFDHWASMQDAWRGYSYAAAASMETLFGNPDQALSYLLEVLVDETIVADTQITPNTMYREGSDFAIESPLAAAQSLLDMLVQSHGGTVRGLPPYRRVGRTCRSTSCAPRAPSW